VAAIATLIQLCFFPPACEQSPTPPPPPPCPFFSPLPRETRFSSSIERQLFFFSLFPPSPHRTRDGPMSRIRSPPLQGVPVRTTIRPPPPERPRNAFSLKNCHLSPNQHAVGGFCCMFDPVLSIPFFPLENINSSVRESSLR